MQHTISTGRYVVAILLFAATLVSAPSGHDARDTTGDRALTNTPATATAHVYLPYIGRSGPALATPSPTRTVTATSTQSPTSTPTRSATPTSTPTEVTTPIAVMPNYAHYVDNSGHLRIVGEVRNHTPGHLRSVRITAKLFREDGYLLDSEVGHTKLNKLPPGDRTCFDVLFWDQPANWSYYDFQINFRHGGAPLPNLNTLGEAGSQDPASGWYIIAGQIRNDHGTRVEYVKPVGTLYDAGGAVVDCQFTFVDTVHLENGQTSDFELTFRKRGYDQVRSYRLQVDGNPIGNGGATPTASPTGQATPTATATGTAPASPTPTPSRTAMASPTATPPGTPTGPPTGTTTATPTLTRTPAPTGTATPTATATPAPTHAVQITFIQYPGDNEYVRIENTGATAQDLTDWHLLSGLGQERYAFPAGHMLEPESFVRIHSGPDAINDPPFDMLWTTAYVWDDDGDRAELYDSEDRLVDRRCYKRGCD